MMGYLKERHGMVLLPAQEGVCPECGEDHERAMPHNRDTLLYQYTFYDKHGRFPCWADAMSHCEEKIQAYWKSALKDIGIDIEEIPEMKTLNITITSDEEGAK